MRGSHSNSFDHQITLIISLTLWYSFKLLVLPQITESLHAAAGDAHHHEEPMNSEEWPIYPPTFVVCIWLLTTDGQFYNYSFKLSSKLVYIVFETSECGTLGLLNRQFYTPSYNRRQQTSTGINGTSINGLSHGPSCNHPQLISIINTSLYPDEQSTSSLYIHTFSSLSSRQVTAWYVLNPAASTTATSPHT